MARIVEEKTMETIWAAGTTPKIENGRVMKVFVQIVKLVDLEKKGSESVVSRGLD